MLNRKLITFNSRTNHSLNVVRHSEKPPNDMDYQTFEPHSDLKSLVNCYWTLEVPKQSESQKQRIVPDGCIEMAFILGDDIKRYTSENEFILQPRAMVLGQTIEPFYIEPTGFVKTFAVRFYPYGFANFVSEPISNLVNKETPISKLFEKETVDNLEQKIIQAGNTKQRISIVEKFLTERLNNEKTIDKIVKIRLIPFYPQTEVPQSIQSSKKICQNEDNLKETSKSKLV